MKWRPCSFDSARITSREFTFSSGINKPMKTKCLRIAICLLTDVFMRPDVLHIAVQMIRKMPENLWRNGRVL